MIYQIFDHDTQQWLNPSYTTLDETADYANVVIKSAMNNRQRRRLSIFQGGNVIYVEYNTTGAPWYT